MATNLWTADRRLYLDKDGKAVEADDPARVSLLVNIGGAIPLADAERLGLVEVVPAEVKAIEPKVNKAMAPAPANKGRATIGTRPGNADPGEQEDGQGLAPVKG
jgi:hypothetical protein